MQMSVAIEGRMGPIVYFTGLTTLPNRQVPQRSNAELQFIPWGLLTIDFPNVSIIGETTQTSIGDVTQYTKSKRNQESISVPRSAAGPGGGPALGGRAGGAGGGAVREVRWAAMEMY